MIVEETLRGILAADRHEGGIRCLRLFRVEEGFFGTLAGDVERLCRSNDPSYAGRPDHVTNWTRPFGDVLQYSLLNESGRYDDFTSDHDLSCFGKRFHEAPKYPALARLVECFPHTVNFRINVLGPGAGLSPHEEHVAMQTHSGKVGARVRFHLPIATNGRAELMLDGWSYHLDEGTIYFVNHGCVHAAVNRGDAPRVHLVWDMLLTADAFALMFGNGLATLPLLRIPEDQSVPEPLRVERAGAHRALPPRVALDDESTLELCEPQ
jgi:hypothetical protein